MPVGSSDFMAEVAACIMEFEAAANVAIIASTATFGIEVVADTLAAIEKLTAVNFLIKPIVPDSGEQPTIFVQAIAKHFGAFQATSQPMVVITDSS